MLTRYNSMKELRRATMERVLEGSLPNLCPDLKDNAYCKFEETLRRSSSSKTEGAQPSESEGMEGNPRAVRSMASFDCLAEDAKDQALTSFRRESLAVSFRQDIVDVESPKLRSGK